MRLPRDQRRSLAALWHNQWLIMCAADTQPVAMFIALGTILWGLSVLNPYSAPLSASVIYRPLVDIATFLSALGFQLDPESFWGSLMLTLGLLHAYGVLWGSRFLRTWCVFAALMLRIALTSSIVFSGNWMLPIFGDMLIQVSSAFWVYWRIKRAHRSAWEPVAHVH